jgi:hypothetical protein
MKPCPFCSSSEIEYESDNAAMTCMVCLARGPVLDDDIDSNAESAEEIAEELWDERT